jgi:potassium-transporting ATPase KdpC subunit
MKQFRISLIIIVVMTVLFGIVYPLAITGIAKLAFPEKSGGSLVKTGDEIRGSELISQAFTGPKYFHGRPSANNYDGTNSGGTNFGPTNKKLYVSTAKLAVDIRKENNLPADTKIPADLVLSSGSGLDPHISLDSAILQIPRIASSRKMKEDDIIVIIKKNTETRYFEDSGDSFVNVLKLNIALDSK